MEDPTLTHRDNKRATDLDAELDVELDPALVRSRQQRQALKSRHTQALVKLLDDREDLRGVHALADLVADSLRWTA